MVHDIDRLATDTLDVLVVEGGIIVAFVAMCAAGRSYRVALVERSDFASYTTSGSGRALPSGIRYLRHSNLRLAAEATRERWALAVYASQLTRELPFFALTRTNRFRERWLLRRAATRLRQFPRLYSEGHPPSARYVGTAPGGVTASLGDRKCPGGQLPHDLQFRSPERLSLAVVQAATGRRAIVANYVKAAELKTAQGRLYGATIKDLPTNPDRGVRATIVFRAAGARTPSLWNMREEAFPVIPFARGIHVVLDRPQPAVALALPYRDAHGSDNPGRGRNVFVIPGKERPVVSAAYAPFEDDPEACRPLTHEVQEFISQLDASWPGLAIGACWAAYAFAGLYPIIGRDPARANEFAAARRSLVIDNAKRGGPRGLISAIGVKFTAARVLGEHITDLVSNHVTASEPTPCTTSDSSPKLGPLAAARPTPQEGVERCVQAFLEAPSRCSRMVETTVRHKMVLILADSRFHRTWPGHLGLPADPLLRSQRLWVDNSDGRVRRSRASYRRRERHMHQSNNWPARRGACITV